MKNGRSVSLKLNNESSIIHTNVLSLSRGVRLVLLALLLLAATDFFFRGPLRAWKGSNDFAIVYLASTAWVRGMDPYDHSSLKTLWIERGGDPRSVPDTDIRPSVYPLSAFPLLSPLTLLKWNHAKRLWLIINCLALLLQTIALLRLTNVHGREFGAVVLIVGTLLLAPIRAAVSEGQPAVLAIACIIVSVWLSTTGRNRLAGLFIALGSCIKPQMGIPFLLYFACRRQWGIFWSSLLIISGISLVSILNLGFDTFSYLWSWKYNLYYAAGGVNNPTDANLWRYNLLNIQSLLYSIFINKTIINTIVIIMVIFQAVFFILSLRLKAGTVTESLQLSYLSIIILLPVYHRVVDAIILLLPLSFSLIIYDRGFTRIGLVIAALLSPFLINGPTLLASAVNLGFVPKYIGNSNLFNIIIMPHHIWALFILSIIMWCLIIYFLFKPQYLRDSQMKGLSY